MIQIGLKVSSLNASELKYLTYINLPDGTSLKLHVNYVCHIQLVD